MIMQMHAFTVMTAIICPIRCPDDLLDDYAVVAHTTMMDICHFPWPRSEINPAVWYVILASFSAQSVFLVPEID